MERRRMALAAAAGAVLLASASATAATQILDDSFAGRGFRFTDFGHGSDRALDAAIQRDGKVVVVGWANGKITSPSSPPSKDADIAVARYTLNGRLDRSFSGDGIAQTDISGTTDIAQAVALQRDGGILVAGFAATGTGSSDFADFALVRYRRNGSLDTSFGEDGIVITRFPPPTGGLTAEDLVLDRRGRIVVVGRGATDESDCCFQDGFAVARHLPNGALDESFADDGTMVIDVAGKQGQWARAVAIQPNGRIVVGGDFDPDNSGYALIRLREGGSLDRSFSGDGKVVKATSGDHPLANCRDLAFAESIEDLLVQGDGRIVATGASYRCGGNIDFAVLRYLSSGRPDRGFSKDGRVRVGFRRSPSFSDDVAYGVASWWRGRIVVGGTVQALSDEASTDHDFALAMLRPSGRLDRTFSRDGRHTLDLGREHVGTSEHDDAYGMARGGRRLVLAGTSIVQPEREWDWAVARIRIPGAAR
jgi:uncharacterized delta-60 repeat protein